MTATHEFDERIAEGFREGTVPVNVHTCIGQESCAVGVCSAMRNDDPIWGTHLGHGPTIAKGANIVQGITEVVALGYQTQH